MPILVVCKCGKRFNVKEEHAGKKGKCPACAGVVQIPAAPDPQAAPLETRASGGSSAKTNVASSKKPLVFAGLGLGSVVMIAAAWASFSFFRAGPPPADPEQKRVAEAPKPSDASVPPKTAEPKPPEATPPEDKPKKPSPLDVEAKPPVKPNPPEPPANPPPKTDPEKKEEPAPRADTPEALVLNRLGDKPVKAILDLNTGVYRGAIDEEKRKEILSQLRDAPPKLSAKVEACRARPACLPTVLELETPVVAKSISTTIGSYQRRSPGAYVQHASDPAKASPKARLVTWYRYGTLDVGVEDDAVLAVRIRAADALEEKPAPLKFEARVKFPGPHVPEVEKRALRLWSHPLFAVGLGRKPPEDAEKKAAYLKTWDERLKQANDLLNVKGIADGFFEAASLLGKDPVTQDATLILVLADGRDFSDLFKFYDGHRAVTLEREADTLETNACFCGKDPTVPRPMPPIAWWKYGWLSYGSIGERNIALLRADCATLATPWHIVSVVKKGNPPDPVTDKKGAILFQPEKASSGGIIDEKGRTFVYGVDEYSRMVREVVGGRTRLVNRYLWVTIRMKNGEKMKPSFSGEFTVRDKGVMLTDRDGKVGPGPVGAYYRPRRNILGKPLEEGQYLLVFEREPFESEVFRQRDHLKFRIQEWKALEGLSLSGFGHTAPLVAPKGKK